MFEKKKKNPKTVGVGRMFAWQSRAVSQGCALINFNEWKVKITK